MKIIKNDDISEGKEIISNITSKKIQTIHINEENIDLHKSKNTSLIQKKMDKEKLLTLEKNKEDIKATAKQEENNKMFLDNDGDKIQDNINNQLQSVIIFKNREIKKKKIKKREDNQEERELKNG